MNNSPTQKIRDSLEERIIDSEFSDGARLDENLLSTNYGVSRTPVREALQRLVESGLAEHFPRRGTFVRTPSLTRIVEMFEVMAELECMAVKLAIRRATKKKINTLQKDNERCRKAAKENDKELYYEINARLHHNIYEMSGNSFLATEAKKLHDRLRPFRRLQLQIRGRLEESMAEHDIILSAICNEDVKLAIEVMQKHIRIVGVRFNDLVSGLDQIKKI